MKVMLLLSLFLYASSTTSGSYCMSTDCTTQGTSRSFLLYLRVCCVIDNLGRSVTIKGNGINRYILCPRVLPKSCPGIQICIILKLNK